MHWHFETESSRASPTLLNQTYSAGARLPAIDRHAPHALSVHRDKPAPRKEKLQIAGRIWYKVSALSGCRIMALLQLPKLITRVRFPSPAPIEF